MPSRPRSRRSQASYRDGGRRLVPAEPLRPREGTRWRKRGAGASPGALAPRLREAMEQGRRAAGGQSRRAGGPTPALRSRPGQARARWTGAGRASACSRVVLPAPVMPVTRTLTRWLRHGPQASSTPGGHAPIPKRSLDTLVAIEPTLGARHPTGKHPRSPNPENSVRLSTAH